VKNNIVKNVVGFILFAVCIAAMYLYIAEDVKPAIFIIIIVRIIWRVCNRWFFENCV